MSTLGIEKTLESLTRTAWENQLDPRVRQLACKLTGSETSRQDKMRALVDDLHRIVVSPWGPSLDADDACVFVAAAAMSVDIPCRFIGVRYGQSWTCWLQYEAGIIWETIDPLRQKTGLEPDEQVIGPFPG